MPRGKYTRTPPEERFWSKVEKTDGCWLWTGSVQRDGYAVLQVQNRQWRASRYSYFLATGSKPGNLLVCHTCDNPLCVRPDHLFLGTQKDNIQDAIQKGRLATGDKSRSRLYPETLHRGEAHWSRRMPERVASGERSGAAKMTWEQVRSIRARYQQGGITKRQLAKEQGVSECMVGDVLNGKTWRES